MARPGDPILQGRPSTPGPSQPISPMRPYPGTTPHGPAQVRLVSTEEKLAAFCEGKGMFDVDMQGDLVEPGRFLIFAWKTNGDEEGTRVEASTPSEAGRKFAELLRSGHVQFTASKIDSDGRVAYP